MKKIISTIVIFNIFIFGSVIFAAQSVDFSPENQYLADYSVYKKIKPDNIKALKILRYTEAGISERDVSDKSEINAIYNSLKTIKILGETGLSCTDNTTIFSFKLNDDSKVSVEIECEWLVIKGKHYKFESLSNL